MITEKDNNKVLSAYEKAAEAGTDPRCIPQHLSSPPPVGDEIIYPDYTDDDSANWKLLYNRQIGLLDGRVCREYIHGASLMGFTGEKIASLAECSKVLYKTTGWKIARIPGLLHEADFFGLLKERIFPSTDYVRGKHEIDYTPAPDMFHDVFGHLPLLTNPNFANFYSKFGIAALNAQGEQRIQLERLHWFTVEFGLINTPEGRRIYGAGIVSSLNEVEHSLSDKVTVHPFEPERIAAQEYEVWHLQPVYYAINSFEELEQGFDDWTKKQGLL